MEDKTSNIRIEVEEHVSILQEWSSNFAKLLPVTYRSKIKWFGGIPGAIIEAKEESRMVKLLNAEVIDNYSYGIITEMAFDKIKTLGEKTRALQSLMDENDPEIARIGNEVIGTILSFIKNWKGYSPDLAQVVLLEGKRRKKEDKSFLEKMLLAAAEGAGGVVASSEMVAEVSRLSMMLF